MVIEPLLTPLMAKEFSESSNTSNQARADVSARGLWINGQTAFCDVSVFNPVARFHLNHRLPTVQKEVENRNKREYDHQILQVEHGPFTNVAVSFCILLNVSLTEKKP